MKSFTCWDIEQWDGGDRCNHSFYVATKEEAIAWKITHKYDSLVERSFVIFDSIAEYEESKSKETKERALAKLTPIERKALGF